ncbi:MAG: hypothetical protein ACJ79K_08780 [Gemmatimonadaceae bacterium]
MHDGPTPGAAATVEGGAHAAHGSHQAPNGGTPHCCTCLGACCASSGAVTLAAAPELPAPVIGLPSPSVVGAPRVAAPAARPIHTLPFANGPPTAIA